MVEDFAQEPLVTNIQRRSHSQLSNQYAKIESKRLYLNRVAGGHCHYCHFGGAAASSTVKSQREGSKHRVQKSLETNRPWTTNVCFGLWLLSADGGTRHQHFVL